MNAVNPETNGLLHTKLKPATTKVLVHSFLTELGESCERDASRLVNAVFLVDGSHSLQDACHRHGSDFRCEKHGNRNAFERIFGEIKRRTIAFSSCFSNTGTETADDWLRSFSFLESAYLNTTGGTLTDTMVFMDASIEVHYWGFKPELLDLST